MTVVLLLRSLEGGGTERQAVTLARGLADRHSVIVVTFYGGGAFESEIQNSRVRGVTVAKRSRYDLPVFLWRVYSLLRRVSPDVIYSFLPIPNIVGSIVGLLLRARVVWSIRASRLDTDRYDWMTRLALRTQRWLARLPNVIISNSAAGTRDIIADGFPPARIVTIPNGIDTTKFDFDREGRATMRRKWSITDDEILIGVVARIDPMKGHDVFLKAASQLAYNTKLKFVCVGAGSAAWRSQLEELTLQLRLGSRILWANMHSDLPAVYSALDIVCLPSTFGEGFPNVLAEAMACGTYCVATDVGDSARILDHYGVIVAPGDPVALASGLSDAIACDRSERRVARRESILSRFGVARMVEATEHALGVGQQIEKTTTEVHYGRRHR